MLLNLFLSCCIYKSLIQNKTFHLGFYSLSNVFSHRKHISFKSNISALLFWNTHPLLIWPPLQLSTEEYLLASFIILMRVLYLCGKLEQNWIVVPQCEPFSFILMKINWWQKLIQAMKKYKLYIFMLQSNL